MLPVKRVRSRVQSVDVEAAKLSKLKLKPGRGVEALVDFDVLTPTEEHADDHDPFAVRGRTRCLIVRQFCLSQTPCLAVCMFVWQSLRLLRPCRC